jgi:hypothetical protein
LEKQRILQEIEERATKRNDADGGASSNNNGPLTRGDWMIVPPEANRLNVGLSEMKSRTFSKSVKEDDVDQSGWTALPGQNAGKEVCF